MGNSESGAADDFQDDRELVSGGSGAQEAGELLAAVIRAVSAEGAKASGTDEPRLFFPKGIDLISLEFKVGASVNIALKISGEACCGSGANAGSSPASGSSSRGVPRARSQAAATSFSMGPDSISERVNEAIAQQLRTDGRWPPNNLTASMEDNYNYDSVTLQGFLTAVQQTLSDGFPSLTFRFDHDFVIAALAMTVGELMGAVDGRTS